MALIRKEAKALKSGDIVFDVLSGQRIGQLIDDPRPSGVGPWVFFSTEECPSGICLGAVVEKIPYHGCERCFGNDYEFNVIPWSKP